MRTAAGDMQHKRHRKRKHKSHAWTEAHVRRLFWRAGFGATPEEAATWTARGRAATIEWLLNGDGGPEFSGSEARPGGKALAPRTERADSVLWWLDRMARSRRPLVEKMALFWHGHFATKSDQMSLLVDEHLMLREHALGRFPEIVKAVTPNPAMLQFLDLANSDKAHPNENYARELMELFTLGSGYTEDDIRAAARALTGFTGARDKSGIWHTAYDPARHDAGPEQIFGQTGAFDSDAVADLVCGQHAHGPFIVEKLWNYFVTTPMDRRTRHRLAALYRRRGLRIAPVVKAILSDDALYTRLSKPDRVKSPAVFLAGALRATSVSLSRPDYAWSLATMGQFLFDPPSVAGWEDGPAWMSSASMRSRFQAVTLIMREPAMAIADGSTPHDLSADQALDRAWNAVGRPFMSSRTAVALRATADRFMADAPTDPKARSRRADVVQRTLRHFLLSSPEAQLH
jgi:uncharacterized protein (DUF1800 family)